MLNQLRSFFRRLLTQGRRRGRPFDFPSIEFPPLDVDRTAEQLKLQEQAIANGSQELPPSDASGLDGPQAQIIQFIRGEVADIRAGYVVTLKGLNHRIELIDLRHDTEAIRNLDESLRQELEDLSAESRAGIRRARKDYQHAHKDLRLFKLRNNLLREPDYPASHLLYGSILASVLVLEALINAFFFQRGSMWGYSGGAILALTLAFVDVLAVFWLGRWIAWMVSPKWVYRSFSILVATVFAIWALGYNLFTAHIREQLQAQQLLREASEQALQHFRANPLGLEQADSWLLFSLGLVFSVLAMASGLNWDEKFPGYGKRHRRRNELRDEYMFHGEELLRRGSAIRDEKLELLDRLLRKAHNDLGALKHKIETKDAIIKAVTECISHYRDSSNALIQRYRDENQRARSTPRPRYFDAPVSISLPPPVPDNTDRDHEKLDLQETAFEDVMALATGIREKLNLTYRSFRDQETPQGESDMVTPGAANTQEG